MKKIGLIELLAGFTPKKASTRRVHRKITDSTRNQRVFFSRYLAANYGRRNSNLSVGSAVIATALPTLVAQPHLSPTPLLYLTT